MTLTEASEHIGHGVVYMPLRSGASGGLPRDAEYGVITSVNEYWAFVRYEGSQQPKATDPAELRLLAPAGDGQ